MCDVVGCTCGVPQLEIDHETQQIYSDADGYGVVCRCGWESIGFDWPEEAYEVTDEHLREVGLLETPCTEKCVRHHPTLGCLDEQDLAELALQARDYEGWANL